MADNSPTQTSAPNTTRRLPLPKPLPKWELPAVVVVFLLVGWFAGWQPAFSIGLGGLLYLMQYVENERERWEGLVEIVANANLGALELEARLKQIEPK